jgi:ADP-heptose:LPS heptosyltransferase
VDAVAPTRPLGRVRVRRPRLAVNLHGRGPESTATLRATDPVRLWAFDAPGGPRWDAADGEHEVTRWCRFLAAYGVPCDAADLDLPVPDVAPAGTGRTVVHPGGAAPARRWPPRRWAAVAAGLAAAGHRVVVTGSRAETALATQVARDAGLSPAAVLTGADLLTLCATVARARMVVSADTGVAHLATAYRTPSVVLFGPVGPAEWGPPPGRPQHACLWAGRPGDPGAAAPDPGLLSFTPDDVLAAAASLEPQDRPSSFEMAFGPS